METKTQTLASKKDVNHVKQNNSAIHEINTLIEATSNDFDNSIKELSNKTSINNKYEVDKNKSLSEEKVNYKDEVKKSGLEMIETKEK